MSRKTQQVLAISVLKYPAKKFIATDSHFFFLILFFFSLLKPKSGRSRFAGVTDTRKNSIYNCNNIHQGKLFLFSTSPQLVKFVGSRILRFAIHTVFLAPMERRSSNQLYSFSFFCMFPTVIEEPGAGEIQYRFLSSSHASAHQTTRYQVSVGVQCTEWHCKFLFFISHFFFFFCSSFFISRLFSRHSVVTSVKMWKRSVLDGSPALNREPFLLLSSF